MPTRHRWRFVTFSTLHNIGCDVRQTLSSCESSPLRSFSRFALVVCLLLRPFPPPPPSTRCTHPPTQVRAMLTASRSQTERAEHSTIDPIVLLPLCVGLDETTPLRRRSRRPVVLGGKPCVLHPSESDPPKSRDGYLPPFTSAMDLT